MARLLQNAAFEKMMIDGSVGDAFQLLETLHVGNLGGSVSLGSSIAGRRPPDTSGLVLDMFINPSLRVEIPDIPLPWNKDVQSDYNSPLTIGGNRLPAPFVPVPSIHLEIPDALLPWDNELIIDINSILLVLRLEDPQEGMLVTQPGPVHVPGPLSERYIDSAVSMLMSLRAISGEADDTVRNLVVANAIFFDDYDENDLADTQEHVGGVREEISAMQLTDIVLTEPMDPNHCWCQVLFINTFIKVVVDLLVILIITVIGAVVRTLFLLTPEGGNGVGEGLEVGMLLTVPSPMIYVPSTPFTSYPTASPVTHQFAKIKYIVYSVSDSDTLEYINSPQFLSLSWLADEDIAQVISEAHDRIKQRYIITVFYFSLENVSWLLECGFMNDKHEFSWRCDALGLVCRSKRVTIVDLDDKYISGTIFSELGYL